MEITVNIPQNTYVTPTEIRPDAVQKICDAFLRGGCNRIFHPYSDGPARPATLCAYRSPKFRNPDRDNKDHWFYGFSDERWCSGHEEYEFVRFNGREMRAAFEALRKAGYHMFRAYYYNGEQMGYVSYNKPEFRDGNVVGSEVTDFTDFID